MRVPLIWAVLARSSTMSCHQGGRCAPAAADTQTDPCLAAAVVSLVAATGAPKQRRAELICLVWAAAELALRWAARAERAGWAQTVCVAQTVYMSVVDTT